MHYLNGSMKAGKAVGHEKSSIGGQEEGSSGLGKGSGTISRSGGDPGSADEEKRVLEDGSENWGSLGSKRMGCVDLKVFENPDEKEWKITVLAEPGTARVFGKMHEAKHRAEGAAGGDHDVHCGEIFRANHYATGNPEHAGGARSGISRGDFQNRAPILGQPTGAMAEGFLEDFA